MKGEVPKPKRPLTKEEEYWYIIAKEAETELKASQFLTRLTHGFIHTMAYDLFNSYLHELGKANIRINGNQRNALISFMCKDFNGEDLTGTLFRYKPKYDTEL